jgi:hypothetical protein
MVVSTFGNVCLFRAVVALCAAMTWPALPTSATARQAAPPISRNSALPDLTRLPETILAPIDPVAEFAADAKRGRTGPLRFAVPAAIQVTPDKDGTWDPLPNGGRVWRWRVSCAGATDLNFCFAAFHLPEGATLHVGSGTEVYFQGPYTARDNKDHGQLWTPVLPGGSAWAELFVPAGAVEQPRLLLTQIGCGYRDLFRRGQNNPIPQAGSCNVDVICPEADSWRDEIRSVAVYTISGTYACSGTLIMDAPGDFRSYFLSAAHCGVNSGNAPSVVVYWNYFSPACGQHGGGSLSQNQIGAVFRASRADADFLLLELEGIPDSSVNAYYAGWDRSTVPPSSSVGIHHPRADEKSISFSFTPLIAMENCVAPISGLLTHWRVTFDLGTTEPGSSGSGLWNSATHLLTGFLTGGLSSCDRPDGYDCYGRFSVAWDGTSASTRLRDWLDSGNTNPLTKPGSNYRPFPNVTTAGFALLSEDCLPPNGVLDAGETVTVSFSLQNTGHGAVSNLVATLLVTNGVVPRDGPQSYGAMSGGGPVVARNFTFTVGGPCGLPIAPTLQLTDGTNNLPDVSFVLPTGSPVMALYQDFDGTAVPALPAEWAATGSAAIARWVTTSAQFDTAPGCVFAPNPGVTNDNRLISPLLPITSPNARLTFRHSYNTEQGFDGGVLELSTNDGPFIDILVAGGAFVSGGYNGNISGNYGNPAGGRPGWTGNSGSFITTIVQIPASAAGKTVRLRWRFGSDASVGAVGWYVDTISLNDGYACCRILTSAQLVNPRIVLPNQFAFSFQSSSNVIYVMEACTNLTLTNWFALSTNLGDGTLRSITNLATEPQKILRLRAQ